MKFVITALGKDGKARKLQADSDEHRAELYKKLKAAGYKVVKLMRVDEHTSLKSFIKSVLQESDVETKKTDVTSKNTQTVTPQDTAAKKDDEKKDLLLDKLAQKETELDEIDALDEVAPEGWEGTVKSMKKHKDIDNPWALAWSMKNKGYKSRK